jgi:hypothetical protein
MSIWDKTLSNWTTCVFLEEEDCFKDLLKMCCAYEIGSIFYNQQQKILNDQEKT